MNKNGNKKFRIALDAMGGDFAPINEINGAVEAHRDKPLDMDFEVVLVGKEKTINSNVGQLNNSDFDYSIVNANEVITMRDDSRTALKQKRDSSMFKGLELLSRGEVDAFVSAGNTGAILTTATVLMGRMNGVSRPTIGSLYPTQNDTPSLMLDVGANVEIKPRYLYEFAVMGSIFVNQAYGMENPRVGLLNIGEEESKGSAAIQEAYSMLKDSQLNFIGNIEGRDVLKGTADVVVCDGFTGNILLKFAESFPGFLKGRMKEFARQNLFNKAITIAMIPFLKKVLKSLDYEEYGGVPLLGVNGAVIIGHGKSSPKAIKTMIYRAVELVKKDVNKKIENTLNPPVYQKKD